MREIAVVGGGDRWCVVRCAGLHAPHVCEVWMCVGFFGVGVGFACSTDMGIYIDVIRHPSLAGWCFRLVSLLSL